MFCPAGGATLDDPPLLAFLESLAERLEALIDALVDGRYDRNANIASFVGFIPAEFPELTIIIVVDEPQPIHTGGRVAGPIFKEIAEQVVRYLAVPPEGSDNLFPLVAGEDRVTEPASG